MTGYNLTQIQLRIIEIIHNRAKTNGKPYTTDELLERTPFNSADLFTNAVAKLHNNDYVWLDTKNRYHLTTSGIDIAQNLADAHGILVVRPDPPAPTPGTTPTTTVEYTETTITIRTPRGHLTLDRHEGYTGTVTFTGDIL